jgi:centromeric protein E
MNRNSIVPSTPKGFRPPFTPKRHLSIQSTPSTTNDPRLSRTNSNSSTNSSLSTPQTLLSTTHKKYKAPLSVESRSKSTYGKIAKPVLATVPGTPTRKDGTQSRPRTPNTPRKGAESPSLMPAAGEMDVSNVDPERVLVDYQTVEPGDVSGEIDEAWLRAAELDHGKQDKVMVSIRLVSFPFIMQVELIHANAESGRRIQLQLGSPLHPTTLSNWTLHMPRTQQPPHPTHRSISMQSSQERLTNPSIP